MWTSFFSWMTVLELERFEKENMLKMSPRKYVIKHVTAEHYEKYICQALNGRHK